MGTKDETIHIKVRGEEKQDFVETAEELDIPVSQFIREAAREKVAAYRAAKAAAEAVEPAGVPA